MASNSYHASMAAGAPNTVSLPASGGTGPDIPDESGQTSIGSTWSREATGPHAAPLRLALLVLVAAGAIMLIHRAGFRGMVAIGG